MLGLLICAVVGSFVGFVLWQHRLAVGDQRQLLAHQWVLAMGAFTAMIGWLTSALVTARNSVKQHTITTLLQSRLSVAYMERLRKVNDAFAPVGGTYIAVTEEDFADANKAEALSALRYLLNYFEFIAVAIRHGDLDEKVMNASMSGIVSALSFVGHAVIEKGQSKDPLNFEHLDWLRKRWDEKNAKDWETFFISVGGILLAVLSGWVVFVTLNELAASTSGRRQDALQNNVTAPVERQSATPAVPPAAPTPGTRASGPR